MDSALQLSLSVGIVAACDHLGVSRSTLYRNRPIFDRPRPRVDNSAVELTVPPPSTRQARALSPGECSETLEILHQERFQDCAPAAIHATLLDEGRYVCSPRTMYRILDRQGECRERRDQLVNPVYHKPELLATKPNEVWSWDITKLRGPVKWTYFYLYVVIDVFSRLVTGWLVADRESAELAKEFLEESIKKHGVPPGQLNIHADRGKVMRSKPVAFMLADLGVTKTHSRPYVSDDNPFSESHFHTLKSRPGFPDRFGSIQDARAFCHQFFPWYNNDHRHSGVAMLTPANVHFGDADAVLAQRQAVLSQAYADHPERFVGKPPAPAKLPTAVWINKPANEKSHQESQ
jgi:putative transposase